MSFHIKEGYRENPVEYFLDNLVETRGIIFQPDVYTMAEYLASTQVDILFEYGRDPHILDVGCGFADKLAGIQSRHPDWGYTGIDYRTNIDHCRATYEWGRWLDVDLEDVRILDYPGSIIVCSDVIEHLADPRPLLHSLKASEAEMIVLSTPERDLQHGTDHMGPSPNVNHVREWNYEELHAFLEDEGFTIRWHGLTRSSDAGPYCQTQLVVM